MQQILVRMDDELAKEIRRIVREKYGGRRGALSLVVDEALRKALTPRAEISVATLLDVIDYVSKASSEGQSKDQILANVFIMLDREFEQSIERGMRETKQKGKTSRVPKGRDPIEFLEKLADRT